MKKFKGFFVILFIILFSLSYSQGLITEEILVTNATIGIDISHNSIHEGYFDAFIDNFTSAGNTVEEIIEISNLKKYDVILIPGSTTSYSSEELDEYKKWFERKNKLLFVAGDSDYGGLFKANETLNPILEHLGSSLRLDAGAIGDLYSNDGTDYRVIVNTPENGPAGSIINQGVNQILLHGPTSVYAVIDGIPIDLRTTSPENVEILFSYSNGSQILDQDISEIPDDFYYYNTSFLGDYPAIVAENFTTSVIIVEGEATFSDYKNMYGVSGEYGAGIDNRLFMIKLMNYYFEALNSFKSVAFPFEIVVFTVAIMSIPVILKKNKKVKK